MTERLNRTELNLDSDSESRSLDSGLREEGALRWNAKGS